MNLAMYFDLLNLVEATDVAKNRLRPTFSPFPEKISN